jgi:hypothetical protein
VGAAGAITCGENKFPPVGLMFFSVGEADGGAVVVDVVVVDVVVGAGGAWLPPLPQAARIAPMAIRAAPPQTAISRRPLPIGLMFQLLFYAWAGTARLGCPDVEQFPGVYVIAGTIGLYDPH